MPFVKRVSVRNFRCFRRVTSLELGKSTYLVGINNSGKTAFLSAIHCFFNSAAYSQEYLNKTEFIAKQEGYNKSDITLTFDLSHVPSSGRRSRMIANYGNCLEVRKSFTYREASKTIIEEYDVQGSTSAFDGLDSDIRELFNAVSVSYIHPQEGQQLLEKAQAKFKDRLFNNWGRHPSVAGQLRDLQEQWDELRRTASSYLSSTLTTNLKKIWPHSNIKVNLPEKIEDIVAVSDIAFRSSPALPEVTLTSQGTGAQSTILYQTHYILDSDRSLHRGIYFPVWLLEEPESFLHADIAIQLAKLLNSHEWLDKIQMVISTHSPIILAASNQNPEITRWAVFENYSIVSSNIVHDVSHDDVRGIARKMGDPNFILYFAAAFNKPIVILEDTKEITIRKFVDAGVPAEPALGGIGNIAKSLDVLSSMPDIVNEKIFFIVDSDKGSKEISCYLGPKDLERTERGIERYKVADKIFIILLPRGYSSEDLFSEYDTYLAECSHSIYETNWDFKTSIPLNLTRAVAELRGKNRPADLAEAKKQIKNLQDVKDSFWHRVEQFGYEIASEYKVALRSLMDL